MHHESLTFSRHVVASLVGFAMAQRNTSLFWLCANNDFNSLSNHDCLDCLQLPENCSLSNNGDCVVLVAVSRASNQCNLLEPHCPCQAHLLAVLSRAGIQ